MSRFQIHHRVLVVAALLSAGRATAQGTVSAQGYGYPPGQLTTRASASGGGLAEFDQASPLNPAALMNWGVAGAYFQYSPERRSTTVAGTSTTSTVARFPVFTIGLPIGGRFAFGLSSSTLLDRNFSTSVAVRQQIRADSVTTTTTTSARGSISAVQLGGAMQVAKWLRVGTGVQLVTGENRFLVSRDILGDSVANVARVNFGSFPETSVATFVGSALSFGVDIAPVRTLSVAASARLGFGMRAELSDTANRTADVPNRAGAAVRWEVGGSNLSARYAWEGWSAMKGLGGAANGVFDTKEYGVGAELPGPKLPGGQLLVRIGARSRTLPYGVGGAQPKENILGGGLGLPIGFGRAQLDLGLERASRTIPGLAGVKESGLLMSFGFRIRT